MAEPVLGRVNTAALYIDYAAAFARIRERLPTTAAKPAEMLATDCLAPHVSQVMKVTRFSLARIVSGDLHVWHVTYSPKCGATCATETD